MSEESRAKERARLRAWYEANRELAIAKNKANREANRDRIRIKRKAYYAANREHFLAQSKVRYERTREESQKQQKAYRAAKREKILARKRAEYRENQERHLRSRRDRYRSNPELMNARTKAHYRANKLTYIRHARKRQGLMTGNYTQSDIDALYDKQRGLCGKSPLDGCQSQLADTYHIDHYMPLALDPAGDVIENLQLLCPKCNRRKSALRPDAWRARIASGEYRHNTDPCRQSTH
jgi:5-methylcytosine-specific restriction endonuclease McrA